MTATVPTLRLLACALLLGLLALPATAQNLITNPSCEPVAADAANAPTGWTATGTQPDNDYDCDNYSSFGGPGPDDGSAYFAPSSLVSAPVAAEIYQDISTAGLGGVATGTQKLDFSGAFTVFDDITSDRMQVILEYRDSGGTVLGSYDTGLVGGSPFGTWTPVTQQVTLPAATASVRVRLVCNRVTGTSCDAYADDLSLTDAGSDPVGVSVSDVTVSEGTGVAGFTISLSSTVGSDVDVTYTTNNQTAFAGLDYTFASGTATITAGTPDVSVMVPITGDTQGELTETFQLVLTGISSGNAAIADGIGVGTILDDDGGLAPADNLLGNPSCEPQAVNPSAQPSSWTGAGTDDWDCDNYASSGAPSPQDGSAYFAVFGDASGNVSPNTMQEIYQDVDVTPFALTIGDGTQRFDFRAYQNIFLGSSDRSQIILEYRDGGGIVLGSTDFGPVGDDGAGGWKELGVVLAVPQQTATIRVRLKCNNTSGTTCDAYIDNLVLASTNPASTPVCPMPTIDGEVVDQQAKTVTVTFNANDPSGITTINFTLLTNFTVINSDGFTSSNGVDWTAPVTVPVTATFVLQATASSASYFAVVTNGCGSIFDADPVHDGFDVPATFALEAAYPNPFNPTTTLTFALPEAAEVRLTVYDVTGRLVRTLAQGTLEAGTHAVTWDARDEAGRSVASGLYLYRLEAGRFHETRTMTLLK